MRIRQKLYFAAPPAKATPRPAQRVEGETTDARACVKGVIQFREVAVEIGQTQNVETDPLFFFYRAGDFPLIPDLSETHSHALVRIRWIRWSD
jgi:hypothetical protein